MTPGAHYQAAIEILEAFKTSRLPLDAFLDQWSRSHRFAGSKDRTAIKEIVYTVMRRRAEFVWHMGSEQPRALVLAQLALETLVPLDAARDLFDGNGYNPAPLTDAEAERYQKIGHSKSDPVPEPIRANYPEWLKTEFSFPKGSDASKEWQAMSRRATVDVRVNTLKKDRDAVMEELARQGIEMRPCPYSGIGLRMDQAGASTRFINLRSQRVFKSGWVELQDEGAQIAALLVDAQPKHQVLDLCAGVGGKTLAMAATMENSGQIFAADINQRRLNRMKPRLHRAGAHNVQLLPLAKKWLSAGDPILDEFSGHFDRVLLDVPCSGTGAWRRNPDAKWRLTPDHLGDYVARQREILERAMPLVKPGGRLIYVTCSLLARENQAQISGFLAAHEEFCGLSTAKIAGQSRHVAGDGLMTAGAKLADYLLLSPATTATDGTFIAVLERHA
ncbi:MAG: RsmB/NOP family class I SAM-dependent RNA methyltransferase [Alphaproteobacteria bacterium]|nr:MAG: RsmB/NOP family class I SAM-dependent RNA methyltransferase [Alphaproteobacteria bacterium]